MNLTKTSAFFRKFVIILIAVVFFYYFFVFFLAPNYRKFSRKFFPPKETYNTQYGLLDQLEFVEKKYDKSIKPVFTLNTKDGRLPSNFPLKMTVFKYKEPQYSYQAGQNAIEDAAMLGFTEGDRTSDLRGAVYEWKNFQTGSNLKIDTDTLSLILSTPLSGKTSFYKTGITEQRGYELARNILSSISRYEDPFYKTGTYRVDVGRLVGGRVIETEDPKEAQVALVNFYRKIGNYKVVGTDPAKGLLRAIVGQIQDKQPRVLQNPLVESQYFEIEYPSAATYPILYVDEAWDLVKAGKGVVTGVRGPQDSPFDESSAIKPEGIQISSIYLAYYDTPKAQKYLQPIYVFEGFYSTKGGQGGEITIYFPAISGQYIKPSSN